MRVAVVTAGTIGDLMPYIALTRGLIARGHDAYLVIPDAFAARAARHGAPARTFGEIAPAHIADLIGSLIAERNYFKHPGLIADAHAQSDVEAIGRATFAATRDADVIVSHSLAFMGIIAAEINGKPLVVAHLFPNLIASARMSPDGGDYGRVLNAAGWFAGRAVVRRSADPALNALFRTFDLPPRRDAMLSTGNSAALNLVAISPAVVPRDPLWPASYESTGYWFVDEPAYAPDATLARFIAAGDPPVVISFGAVGDVDGSAMERTALAAATRLGYRAIVQRAGGDARTELLSDGVLRTGFVPHQWLFARARCVVTHGGAGTTAAALRAGAVPIAVYHYGDQRFWGLQTARLGVGPKPLSRSAFFGGALTARLRAAGSSQPMRARVRALGERIRAEDGVAHAVQSIERFASSRVDAAAAVPQPR